MIILFFNKIMNQITLPKIAKKYFENKAINVLEWPSPSLGGSHHGVMAKELKTDTLGKYLNPLYSPSYGLNSIIAVLQQKWLWH